jgi:hypothetical protein
MLDENPGHEVAGMTRAPHLKEVRHIGPKGERDLSGVCSACGDILFARLADTEELTPDLLQRRLDDVFAAHVAEKHGSVAGMGKAGSAS